MTWRWGWAVVLFLAGCVAFARSGAVRCPAEFGSHRIQLNSKFFSGPACSVGPSEIAVDGIKPGDSVAAAVRRWGEPVLQAPALAGGLPVYQFREGVKATASETGAEIWSIGVTSATGTGQTPRGIDVGSRCEDVLLRFGPSHEGPGTYRYGTDGAAPALAVEFQCQRGRVTGFFLSRSS